MTCGGCALNCGPTHATTATPSSITIAATTANGRFQPPGRRDASTRSRTRARARSSGCDGRHAEHTMSPWSEPLSSMTVSGRRPLSRRRHNRQGSFHSRPCGAGPSGGRPHPGPEQLRDRHAGRARAPRFTMLLHLPRMEGYGVGLPIKNGRALIGHGAKALRDAITRTIATLPAQLRRPLT